MAHPPTLHGHSSLPLLPEPGLGGRRGSFGGGLEVQEHGADDEEARAGAGDGRVVGEGRGDEPLELVVPVGPDRRGLLEVDVREPRALVVQLELEDAVDVGCGHQRLVLALRIRFVGAKIIRDVHAITPTAHASRGGPSSIWF